jgi:hypothetical protein
VLGRRYRHPQPRTPTLLSVFVRQDRLASADALDLLDALREARSWDTNSYVQRARSLLAE